MIGSGSQVERRFEDLLRQLRARCVESEDEIVAMTWKVAELLQKKGISGSVLAIMEGLNRATAGQAGRVEYARYCAGYTTLRGLGRSHSEAIGELERFGVPH